MTIVIWAKGSARFGLTGGGQIWYAFQGMGRGRAALRLVGIGWYIGLSIFFGVWGGLWLDDKLDTKPIFIIAGLILGVVVAFYGAYRMLIPLIDNRRNKEDS